jgi:hypothetical protein
MASDVYRKNKRISFAVNHTEHLAYESQGDYTSFSYLYRRDLLLFKFRGSHFPKKGRTSPFRLNLHPLLTLLLMRISEQVRWFDLVQPLTLPFRDIQ